MPKFSFWDYIVVSIFLSLFITLVLLAARFWNILGCSWRILSIFYHMIFTFCKIESTGFTYMTFWNLIQMDMTSMKWSNISVFTHLFNQHLMSTHCVPGPVRGPEYPTMAGQKWVHTPSVPSSNNSLHFYCVFTICKAFSPTLHCLLLSFWGRCYYFQIWMRLLKLGNFKTEVLGGNNKYLYRLFSHKNGHLYFIALNSFVSYIPIRR